MAPNKDPHPDLGDYGAVLDAADEDADPLPALGLLAGIRSRLDAVERQLIGSARYRGDSWARIAEALGLASRQAAEQRLLRLSGEANRDPGPVRELVGRQRSVDRAYGPELAKLRPAVVAAVRQLSTRPQWTGAEPRAALALTTLSLAATADSGALFSLAVQALADLDLVSTAPPAPLLTALDRLRTAVAAARPCRETRRIGRSSVS